MTATSPIHGDFTFMKQDADSIRMLTDMYDAVSKTDNWDNLRRFIPGDGGFMFCDKPAWFSQFNKAMNYDGHSGSSFGWAIRNIEYIAKYGWDNFVLKQTSTSWAVKDQLRILELPYAIQEAEATLIAWIKRLENAPDIETLDRLYCRVDEAAQEVARFKNELSYLCPSGAQEGGSHMLTDSLAQIMSTIPPIPPELVEYREKRDAYEAPPTRSISGMPPMPPMGVRLERSVSGMPPPRVFRHHPSMTEEENKNADVAEKYQPAHETEAYQMRVYTDALMKRRDLFAVDAARKS